MRPADHRVERLAVGRVEDDRVDARRDQVAEVRVLLGRAAVAVRDDDLLTLPLASACALTEQIISSRQPLPTSVLLDADARTRLLRAGCRRRPSRYGRDGRADEQAERHDALAPCAANTIFIRSPPLELSARARSRRATASRSAPCVSAARQAACAYPRSDASARRARAPRTPRRTARPTPRPPTSARSRARAAARPAPTSSSAVRTLTAFDERDRGERRAGPDRRLEAVDLDERVPGRRAQVEHDVGVVEQARARECAARRRATARPTSRRRPAARAPRAHAPSRSARPSSPLALKTIIASVGRSSKFARIVSASPRHPLDEHRLPLPVRADDLRVEGHRELDDRVEAGIRAVAREHLLDRDARVAGAEEVDEPAAGDRVGADRRLGDRVGLRARCVEELRAALENRACPARSE